MTQNIFIGPFQTGLQRNVEPFMLPEEAFSELQDAYVWRGRVKKKSGYTFLGRLHDDVAVLPEFLGNTIGIGTFFVAILANVPVSPGTVTVTVGIHTLTDNGNGSISAPTGTFVGGIMDYETGLVFITINPGVGPGIPVNATAYKTNPKQPVMGLALYDTPTVNQEDLIAFNQGRSYLFNTATDEFDEIATGVWNSTDSDFFWTTNYQFDVNNNKLLWETNNIAYNAANEDGIQYYNGTAWILLQAQIDSAAPNPNFLRGSLLLFPYRDRLVALNTLEGPAPALGGAIRHPNRARWSQNGTPLISIDATAWREDIIGKGGFIDAPVGEAIVSAGFNKDTLIVFFERSTWRLRYTGNELLPFIWEQINSEYGAESTFSSVIFDRGILAVGDKRIVSADSINVQPIDEKIPDEVYNFHNDNEGPQRVHGIRDFYRKLVYWTFPNDDPNEIYPDKVLVFNYDNGSWAIYNDSFTTFGTWQKRTDYTWATLPYSAWSEWTVPWGDARAQSFFPNIIAGNQKGFVVVLDNTSSNEESLELANTIPNPSISNTSPANFHIPDHNLKIGQFVRFTFTLDFITNVVGEAVGTAPAGTTQFIGSFQNFGTIPGVNTIFIGANTFYDLGNGTLNGGTGGSIINYENNQFIVNFAALGVDTPVTANYAYNNLNFRVFKVTATTQNTFQLASVNADGSLSPVNFGDEASPSTFFGILEVINNFQVRTKRFSPFLANSEGIRMNYVDVFLKRANGSFTTNVLADQDATRSVNTLNVSSIDEIPGNLSPEKTWKRIFTNSLSDFIQLQFKMSDVQMVNFTNYSSEWELHAMNIEVAPTGRLIGGS